jgi:ADP-heptose:LPS heptosyltransferase
MKVLIIRFSSIGDIVLTTPVVRCLKQQHPEVKIHYLTKAVFWPLLTYNPHITKLHLFNDNLDQVIEELRAEDFDFIIDLHNNLRTARVKKALDVPNAAFPKLNIKKWLLTNLKLDLMPDKSIVERYFEAAEPINVHNDGKGLEYLVPENMQLGNNDIPMSHWGGFVGCVIGGSYATKKLPVAQWQKFCELIPYPVVLIGGPEDRDEGTQIAAQDTIKIYNSCGKFNLNESAELVKHARVIVSNDTGLMHIAAAYKKPIISLWGNTSPEMGMFPYYGYNNLKSRIAPQSVIMENKGLGCHPCSKLGYNKCPKKHFKCMNELDMAQVSAHVQRLWNVEKG